MDSITGKMVPTPSGLLLSRVSRWRGSKVGVYKRPTLKVIYISGGEVPEGFIDQTKTPLLHKPIRQDALLAAVAEALRTPI
jgi:hypothetical protein